ncbi:MAG: hypothetical protein WD512_00970 [Candidatus Paceibacterota bacterium]
MENKIDEEKISLSQIEMRENNMQVLLKVVLSVLTKAQLGKVNRMLRDIENQSSDKTKEGENNPQPQRTYLG